jgi:hypothetical protein
MRLAFPHLYFYFYFPLHRLVVDMHIEKRGGYVTYLVLVRIVLYTMPQLYM